MVMIHYYSVKHKHHEYVTKWTLLNRCYPYQTVMLLLGTFSYFLHATIAVLGWVGCPCYPPVTTYLWPVTEKNPRDKDVPFLLDSFHHPSICKKCPYLKSPLCPANNPNSPLVYSQRSRWGPGNLPTLFN